MTRRKESKLTKNKTFHTELKDAIRAALNAGDVPEALLISLQADESFRDECSNLIPAEARMLAAAQTISRTYEYQIEDLVLNEHTKDAEGLLYNAVSELGKLYLAPGLGCSQISDAIPDAAIRGLRDSLLKAEEQVRKQKFTEDCVML